MVNNVAYIFLHSLHLGLRRGPSQNSPLSVISESSPASSPHVNYCAFAPPRTTERIAYVLVSFPSRPNTHTASSSFLFPFWQIKKGNIFFFSFQSLFFNSKHFFLCCGRHRYRGAVNLHFGLYKRQARLILPCSSRSSITRVTFYQHGTNIPKCHSGH